MSTHIASQFKHEDLVGDSCLHVIGVVSNSARHHSRYRLAREWLERMRATPYVRAYLVEAAHGDRHHEVSTLENDEFMRLRSHQHIWTKESMINIGVRRLLPRGWRYMAWIDTDVEFSDSSWALRTLHNLQNVALLQPWQQAVDLDRDGGIMSTSNSFGYNFQRGVKMSPRKGGSYGYSHPGYAWSCRRDWFESVGGLLDSAILGSGDFLMAWASIGKEELAVNPRLHPNVLKLVKEWGVKSMRVTHGEVGYTSGYLQHFYHGKKSNRRYKDRWEVLVKHGFDPIADLTHDDQGLIHLIGKPELDADIMRYNFDRDEDAY